MPTHLNKKRMILGKRYCNGKWVVLITARAYPTDDLIQRAISKRHLSVLIHLGVPACTAGLWSMQIARACVSTGLSKSHFGRVNDSFFSSSFFVFVFFSFRTGSLSRAGPIVPPASAPRCLLRSERGLPPFFSFLSLFYFFFCFAGPVRQVAWWDG